MQPILFLTIVSSDAAEPWQLGSQDPATPMMQGIIDLHHDIFFFLILILVFVLWILVRALWDFHYKKNPIPERIVHGTTIEILRTISSSIILMFISIPSFALLYSYSMDMVKRRAYTYFWLRFPKVFPLYVVILTLVWSASPVLAAETPPVGTLDLFCNTRVVDHNPEVPPLYTYFEREAILCERFHSKFAIYNANPDVLVQGPPGNMALIIPLQVTIERMIEAGLLSDGFTPDSVLGRLPDIRDVILGETNPLSIKHYKSCISEMNLRGTKNATIYQNLIKEIEDYNIILDRFRY